MICKRLAVIIGQEFGVTILRPGWHTVVVSGPSLSQCDAPFAMTLVFIPSLRQELEFAQNVFCVLELVVWGSPDLFSQPDLWHLRSWVFLSPLAEFSQILMKSTLHFIFWTLLSPTAESRAINVLRIIVSLCSIYTGISYYAIVSLSISIYGNLVNTCRAISTIVSLSVIIANDSV
jgi:hypothetical protein